MICLCIYLGEGRCINAYKCELKNIDILSYRTAWWTITKLGKDEVFMVQSLCYLKPFGQGRIQGGAKIVRQRSPSDSKASATNPMHSNDLEACGKKCCYFWFHSQIIFLMRFDIFLDLVILASFNAISRDFTKMAVMLSVLLRRLTFNRSDHCTPVSDQ